VITESIATPVVLFSYKKPLKISLKITIIFGSKSETSLTSTPSKTSHASL
jgi:hypothetical protein